MQCTESHEKGCVGSVQISYVKVPSPSPTPTEIKFTLGCSKYDARDRWIEDICEIAFGAGNNFAKSPHSTPYCKPGTGRKKEKK